MIPWEKLNLGERPKLVEKSLHYYVHHALSQPYFVDAGEWMLYTMVKQEVIEQNGETYRFCRMTPAKRHQLEVIPRAIQAMYHLWVEHEIKFSNSENEVIGLATIESVNEALYKLRV